MGPWCSGVGGGAVLADDLGLGKSLTTLAFLVMARRAASLVRPLQPMRVLLLCPAVVVAHWLKELGRWLPQQEDRAQPPLLRVVALDPSLSEEKRRQLVQGWGRAGGLLLTSYDMFRAMATAGAQSSSSGGGAAGGGGGGAEARVATVLCDRVQVLVLDEGHRLRTEAAGITQLLKATAAKSQVRLLLTGYPIQNSLLE